MKLPELTVMREPSIERARVRIPRLLLVTAVLAFLAKCAMAFFKIVPILFALCFLFALAGFEQFFDSSQPVQ